MNVLLRAKIVDAYLGTVDINGFKYNKHLMSLGKIENVTCLMPVFFDIYPGEVFESTEWILTCLAPDEKPMEVLVRVDKAQKLDEPDKKPISEYLNAKVVGLLCCSSKCKVQPIGPDAVPFYCCTLKVHNPFYQDFDMWILAFRNMAGTISAIPSGTVVECVVTAKRRRDGNGWEFPVNEIQVREKENK